MSASTIVDRIRVLLENTPPFDQLPEEEREELLSDVSVEYFEPGAVIITQGATTHPGLYIVESGLVRLMDTMRQRLVDKVGEANLFGAFGLLKGGVAIYEARAIEPTVCALLKGDRFQKLYSRNEDFASYFDQDVKRFVRRMGVEMDVAGEHLLFDRSLKQFTHRKLVTCPPEMPARQVASLMKREGTSALLVMQQKKVAGILTDSDLRNRLIARGGAAETPARKLMSSPVYTLPLEASPYEAMMTMLQRQVRRLVLTQDEGQGPQPVTILTDRDIAHLRRQDPVATVTRIDRAASVSELVTIREQTSEQLLNLWRQGAQPEMLHRIMMIFYDRLAIRVLQLVEQELRSHAADERVDLPWAWIRLGSGGRQEMALNSQQHNALVYADPASPEEARRAEQWFNRVAEQVNEALERCGFSMSAIVARDERWRRPLRAWNKAFREWVLQSDEEALASMQLFFDLRGVYGEQALVDQIREAIVDALNVQAMDEQRAFLKLMAANAVAQGPPSSLLGKMRERVERLGESRSVFDLRQNGILPVVDAARVLALECRYLASTNTFDRLRQAGEVLPELNRPVEEALQAYQNLVDFRLESQLRAVEVGDPPTNQIDISALNRMQQRLLRKAFNQASGLLDAVGRRYGILRGKLL